MSLAGPTREQLSLGPRQEGHGGRGTLAGKGLVTAGQSPPWGDTGMSQGYTQFLPARTRVPWVLKAVVNSKRSLPKGHPEAASPPQPSRNPTGPRVGLGRSHIHCLTLIFFKPCSYLPQFTSCSSLKAGAFLCPQSHLRLNSCRVTETCHVIRSPPLPGRWELSPFHRRGDGGWACPGRTAGAWELARRVWPPPAPGSRAHRRCPE